MLLANKFPFLYIFYFPRCWIFVCWIFIDASLGVLLWIEMNEWIKVHIYKRWQTVEVEREKSSQKIDDREADILCSTSFGEVGKLYLCICESVCGRLENVFDDNLNALQIFS